jgi:hypothetical protein
MDISSSVTRFEAYWNRVVADCLVTCQSFLEVKLASNACQNFMDTIIIEDFNAL